MKLKNSLLAFVALLISIAANATITLPRILGHNMVFQQEKPVCIWGTAAAAEQVQVSFAGQKHKTVADATGNWKVYLNPMKSSAEGRDLSIKGTNTILLKDVLVGEVWICSGQSNMEFTMRKNSKMRRPDVPGHNPVDELQYADNPSIRIFLVNRKAQPQPDSLHRGWSVARDSALRVFSAPGYFFAKELYAHLKVPIGMISSAIPGSAIEPWIPKSAFNASVYFKDKKVNNDPGKFYEPMIKTLAPYTIKGFLWYQGETNCFLGERLEYTHKMETLINCWRHDWSDKKLPFYYVQIAPFRYSESESMKEPRTIEGLPEFREAQTAILKMPHTGVIVTTDLCYDTHDIHPSYKWEVGRRLALQALSKTYDHKLLVCEGPVFNKMQVSGNKAIISFSALGSGLVSKDGKPLSDFQIAGADDKFIPADAEIKGNQVIVTASGIAKPKAVRFAWTETAQPNFYNEEGLPARPFRTNNPIVSQFKPAKY